MLNFRFQRKRQTALKAIGSSNEIRARPTADSSTPQVTQIVTHFRLSNAGFSQRNSSRLVALLRLSA